MLAAVVLAIVTAQPAAPERAVLCASLDRPPAETARALEPLGDPARTALLTLAGSAELAEAACGVAGLAALRDRRVVPPLRAALTNPAFRSDAYRFARWAAYVAGGPEADLGPVFVPLVEALVDPVVWPAAGADAIRLLGEVDHATARDRLVSEIARPQLDASLDALIHALARQGEPRVQAQVAALGQEAVGARSGNLTYEQASRIGAVAFYLLALGPATRAEGLQMLGHLAVRDQQDTAAWTVQTWCERAVRRPAERAAAEQARASLAAEFDGRSIQWSQLERGYFTCGPPGR